MKFHKYIAVGTACAVLGGGGIATAGHDRSHQRS